MTVTIVLRLLRGPLREEALVGHAEIVATGESRAIRGTEDLLAVARAAAELLDDAPPTAEPLLDPEPSA